MALIVPKDQLVYIETLLDLPDDDVSTFLGALSAAGPHFNVADLSSEVSRLVQLPRDLVEGILAVLATLYRTKDRKNVSTDGFVDKEVFAALKKAGVFSKENAVAQWAKIRPVFVNALSLENTLGTAAKVGYVMTQHERIFVTARIFTDLRPVFHQNVSEKPGSAVIIHMLQVTQRDNSRHSADLYFALDHNDLLRLKAVIDRALKKEEALKGLMADSGVTVIPPKPTF